MRSSAVRTVSVVAAVSDGDRTGVVERLQARPVEVRPVVERCAQRDVEHRLVRR
jgi:hypothetical protein